MMMVLAMTFFKVGIIFLITAVAVRLVGAVHETISFYYLNPRRIRKVMEKQGVRGPKPRPLVGNLLEMASLISSSTSRPINVIRHDIVARVLPHYELWSKTYGKSYVYWNGFEPRMCLTDTHMIKELLTKYSSLTGKSWLQQQGSKNFIGCCLMMANGDDWHHQRHLLAPSFNGDKLKSYAWQTVECTKKMIRSLQNAMDSGGGGIKNKDHEPEISGYRPGTFTIVVGSDVSFLAWLVGAVHETISFYYLNPRRIRKVMEKQGVRGPKPRPLVGNLLEMASLISSSTSRPINAIHHDIVARLLPHYELWSKTYGKRYVYWNGFEPRMCLTDTHMIKELLTKYSSLTGKSWLQQQGSKNFIGCGLLMANGDDWHHQRHLLAPSFNGEKLKSYAWQTVECTKKMIRSLQNAMDSGGGGGIKNKDHEVEISGYMARLTADIISRIEFGRNYEKGNTIFQLLTTLQHRCAQASRHLCLPGSRYFPSKYNKDIKLLKAEVEKLLMEIIESRKGCVEIGRSDTYGSDLLGVLMNGMASNEDKKKNKGGGGGKEEGFSLNLQLIMDECKTFFFAGHETTALLLTWTVMLLANSPAWQDKVRDEVNRVCNGSTPSVDHLPKLSLLSMVINESLRLYPPATILPRMAFDDIQLGDLLIPQGLSIWIPVLAIHHDKELWGEDANEFNPDRFASTKPYIPGRFIPFGAGPRNCIGQSFALMEAKIILAMLVSNFRFTISDNYRHAPVIVLTIKPKYGVQVCLEPLGGG